MTTRQKRSRAHGIERHRARHAAASATGGGSAARPGPLPHGGGYLDICSDSGATVDAAAPGADPRLAELRRAGLPQPWPRIAVTLGYDAFMAVWQALATVDGADSRRRVVLPKLQPYLRQQRNLLIRSLGRQGLSGEVIRQRLVAAGCEAPTVSHINKLLAEA